MWSGGLSEKKTDSLFGALEEFRSEFGERTLVLMRTRLDEKLEAFLCWLKMMEPEERLLRDDVCLRPEGVPGRYPHQGVS